MQTPAPPPIPVPTLIDDPARLRDALAAHAPLARRNWMQGLGSWQLAALWRLAVAEPRPIALDDLVPGEGVTICPGKNTLPVFSWFEKRFARIDGQIVGYNETGWQKWFVGPGHFTVHQDDEAELVIDYTRPPERTHPDFPALMSNDRLLGWPGPLARLVYGGGMTDALRRVGPSLLIGRASAPGVSLQEGAHFALWVEEGG